MRAVVLACLVALVLAACARPPRAIPHEEPRWTFAIEPPPAGQSDLHVEATFGAATHVVAREETRAAVRAFEQRVGAAWRAPRATKSGWALEACNGPCTVRYTLDLAALALACGRDLDCAMRVDDGTLAPASRWIVRPAGDDDAEIVVRVRGGGPFALGMRRAADGSYVFRASELEESSYTAFARVRKRSAEPIDIALLGGPLAMSDDALARWIGDARSVIAGFFGRFPTPATLFVVPVHGDTVRFGSVSARTGASVALFVGDQMPATPEAEHDDWVLVHELFHLGTPTFVGEGRWLEEGLATYYEPILRTRAGWMTEADLWAHFADQMRRGLREEGSAPSIEDRRDIDSTYWGGALFAMVADVRIRERTKGAHSLDDALRAVLAHGGDVTHVWGVRDFFAFGDRATGTTVLTELHDAFLRGDAVDLAALLASLGVAWRDGARAELHDDRPLSSIRAAIARR